MIYLNPLSENFIDLRDLRCLQLFLIWLASKDRISLGKEGQKTAINNHKAAACYDWNEVSIRMADDWKTRMPQALEEVLAEMTQFFAGAEQKWQEALQHQTEKIRDPEARYAYQVRKAYEKSYLSLGMERAEKLQKEFLA